MKKVISCGLKIRLKLSLAALSATVMLPTANPVLAQKPGPGGGMRGGPGRGMRGMVRGPKMDLERTWRGIGRLQSSLSKAQARRMVALVRPWSNRPTMSDEQAKSLNASLNAVLSTAQKSELAKKRAGGPGGRDGRGGPPPGGFGAGRGGPDGERRGGGPGGDFDPQKMQAMRAKMESLSKTMNPFYAPSKSAQLKSMPDFMQRGMTRRYEESRQTLDALARKAA